MKVGLVCPYSVAKGGGVKEIVFAIQSELRRRGHDAYVITPRPQDHDGEAGDNVLFVGTSADFNAPTRTTIQISASVNDTIDAILEEHQFDVLHFHEPWIPMLSMQILSRSNAVNIGTFHAKLPETMVSRTMAKVVTPYTKSVLKYIDAFTAVSDAAAEYVCSQTNQPVAIIPNGIDLQQFTMPKTFHDNRKEKTVLYVGRLEGRKGVKYLLHAFQTLQERRPDVRLVLAGDGNDREKLEQLAADLELTNTDFLGYVTHEKKVQLYQEADLYCSPAIYGESFGVVLLEAMATGLVTVAGDNPGYSSVMSGLGSLSLVDPKHTAEFARRLELLLYEKDLRKLWRQWAVNELPQYSYEHIVSQYEEVYQTAMLAKAAKKELA
ncbi:MAG TPA: glycosyltransferase family 4 protein [Candidatus Saccharimonadales bacterium]|nr:glycosyltransferase family 4 protein [Candidatus Saccharimonadales bacterium]